jgi:hypothetical protein
VPACPARIALSLVGARLGVGDLAGRVLPGGAYTAVGVLAGLADLSAALTRMLLVFRSVSVWH